MIVIVTVIISIISFSSQTSAQEWVFAVDDTSGGPGRRSGVASWLDVDLKHNQSHHDHDSLWLFGGIGHDNQAPDSSSPVYLNDLWIFSLSDKKWSKMREDHKGRPGHQNVPPGLLNVAACGVPGIMFIIFGGEISPNQPVDDTWVFSLNNSQWISLGSANSKEKTSVKSPARSDAASWCFGKHLVIFGGSGESGAALSDMWNFDLEHLMWSKVDLTGSVPSARYGATTWLSQDRKSLYMYGGSTSSKNTMPDVELLSDLWRYDTVSKTWSLIVDSAHCGINETTNPGKAISPPCRMHAASCSDMVGNLWMYGGNGVVGNNPDTELLADLWKYDIDTNSWSNMTDAGVFSENHKTDDHGSHDSNSVPQHPESLSQAATVTYNGICYILGGINDKAQNVRLSVWQLSFSMPKLAYSLSRVLSVLIFAVALILLLVLVSLFTCKVHEQFRKRGKVSVSGTREDVQYALLDENDIEN